METEKRLIDANALKKQIAKEIHTYWTNGTGGYCLAEDVIPDIDNAPTVDAVEVVRCKDCVYFRPAEDWNGKKYNACYLKPNVCIFEKKMEDFCSCGERRLPQPPKGE